MTNQNDSSDGAEAAQGQTLSHAERRAGFLSRILNAIRAVNQLIVREEDPGLLAERVCAELTATMGYRTAWIALLPNADLGLSRGLFAGSGIRRGAGNLAARIEAGDYPGCMRRALESERVAVLTDPANECVECPVFEDYGGYSVLARRLHADGHLFGVLTVTVPLEYAGEAEQRNLIDEVAGDLAFGFNHMRDQRRLRESERRYRELFEGSRDGFVMVDGGGRILDANPAYCAMLGYTLAELRAIENFFALTPERWHEWEREEIWNRRLLGQGHSGLYEKEYIRKDGTVFPVDLQAYVVRDERGEIQYVWGTVRDLSDRKRTQEAAREATLRLEEAIRAAHVGLWDWDLRTDRVRYSPEWKSQIGYGDAEIGEGFDEWRSRVHPEDLPAAERDVRQAIEQRRPQWQTEFRFRHRDGDYRWILAQASVLTDETGAPVRAIGSHIDITERKQAEDALRHSEHRFRSFVENANDIVYALSPEGLFTYVSPNWIDFIGEPAGHAVDRSFEHYVHPEDIHVCRDFLNTVLESGRKRSSVEYRVRHADGSWRWHLSNGSPMRAPDGRIEGYVGIAHDITEQKLAVEALQRSEARYRSLAENFPHGALFIIDRDWRYQAADGRGLAVAGLRRRDIVGRTVREVFPEIWEILEPNTARAFQGENVYYEVEYRGRLYGNQAAPVMGDCGEVEQVIIITQDITERKAAEKQLRDRNTFIQTILDNLPIGLAVHYEEDERASYINHAFETIYGWPAEDLSDMSSFFRKVYPDPGYRERLERRVRSDIASGDPARMAWDGIEIVRQDGERRIVSARNIPLAEQKLMISTVQDITEMKRAEADLRTSEERYRALIMQSADCLLLHDLDGRIVDVNPCACQTYGYTREQLLGMKIADLDPDYDDRAEDGAFFERMVPGEAMQFEARQRARDGRIFPVEVRLTLVEFGGRTLIQGLCRDITERQQAEAELRASEERFRLLLNDILMVSVQGYAADGTTQYWNRGSERLYGYTASEALGRNLLDLIIPHDMRDEVARTMTRMAETGVPTPAGELELMRKDGSRIHVYSSHSIVQRPGRPLELFCIDIDLSDFRRAEEEREKLKAQLNQAQKMESVGRLAGGVAHDFNNMLNVILGHAEMALDDIDEDDPFHATLKEIRGAAQRSADLTRQLLAFARKQTIAPRLLDLNETIETMLKMLRRLIGEDKVMTWIPAPKLDPVLIDPAQVDQILANLVVNARDAIDDVGTVTIETAQVHWDEDYCRDHAEAEPGDYVMLAVSDDGRGMDAATRARIFEPFYTSKGPGEGTGLGLSTVYGIVRQNKGLIHVYSEPGQGSTFRIYLPASPQRKVETQPQTAGRTLPLTGHETILLVEDESAIRELTGRQLERLGYRVLLADSPGAAIRIAREHAGAIDLLITDVIMPDMNGRDLARQLLSLYPDLKRIFMSGYTANVIAHQGVLDEGVNFLQKPFSQRVLSAKVREVLEGA